MLATGIDIGTHNIRVAVAERVRSDGRTVTRIVGIATAPAKGLRRGLVTDPRAAGASVARALAQASRAAGVPIRRAHLAAGGADLDDALVSASAAIARADAEITELDIERATSAAEASFAEGAGRNHHLLHTVPLSFTLDGAPMSGTPVGMRGARLEAHTLLVGALARNIDALVQAVEEANVEVADIVAAPLAAGLVTLSEPHKIAGVLLADIGAETVSTVLYDEGLPLSVKTFPVGSADITNDLALGFKIPLEEAESLKRGDLERVEYPRKKIADIAAARLADIFADINKHLKKKKRDRLLPAGVVFVGGGAAVPGLVELARDALDLPARVAELSLPAAGKGAVRDPAWAVACGAALLGLAAPDERPRGLETIQHTKESLLSWARKFLP